MTSRKKILAISGSTRKGSSNGLILKWLANAHRDKLDFDFFDDLALLPHFNPDLDAEPIPLEIKHFRDRVASADGILICTPEYIFALPGALKNAIEWTVSTTLLMDKPLAFILASGLGEKTYESLTIIMQTVGTKMPVESTLLIQGARAKITADGIIQDESAKDALEELMRSFIITLDIE
ncbi:MAG: NADPH-dependent FMN reductase [Chryseolinea sp.]